MKQKRTNSIKQKRNCYRNYKRNNWFRNYKRNNCYRNYKRNNWFNKINKKLFQKETITINKKLVQ